jgi:hypothetical protein
MGIQTQPYRYATGGGTQGGTQGKVTSQATSGYPIIVTWRAFDGTVEQEVTARCAIKTEGGNTYYGDVETLSDAGYVTYTHEWTINPDTDVAWVKADLDGLLLGVEANGLRNARITQLFLTWNGQNLRPNGDSVDGVWANSAGNQIDLYAYIDEAVADDNTSYVVELGSGSPSLFLVGIDDPT